MGFISKWAGLLGLLALIVGGDQIRINRPDHKYRLTVEVTTPDGIKAGSGVLAVVPDRNYNRSGRTTMRGEAVLVDLGRGKNLVVLLAHQQGDKLDLDDINYLALRAYSAARGSRVSFKDMSRQTGSVSVPGELTPVLVSFGDLKDPASARLVDSRQVEVVLGDGYTIRGFSAEVVPNGFWPVDFGGPLGEPVTRGLHSKLPWLAGPDAAAATALQAAGLPAVEPAAAREAFARK